MSIGKLYGKIIPNVTIESAGSEGLALTRVDGQVIFVKYGVPGDAVAANGSKCTMPHNCFGKTNK
jgi:tRNA/tmRNA/rRNA uracil-C5-methylase (TrmA/RlmC/RlmD family)